MPEKSRWDLENAAATPRGPTAKREYLISGQICRIGKTSAAVEQTVESLVERLVHVCNPEAPTPAQPEEKLPCLGIVMADELRVIGDTAERTLARLRSLLDRLEI